HLAYAGGWKKFEPMWDVLIRSRNVTRMLPMLETVLAAFGKFESASASNQVAKTQLASTVTT
ncbi:hypothetical protein ABTA76_20200, partial [Acinetobacter baumannii]